MWFALPLWEMLANQPCIELAFTSISSSGALVSSYSFRSVEGLLWGAEPIFKLGPALQQADAPYLDHATPY